MKKIISVILIVSLLFSFASICASASDSFTYYFDSINGDDTNSGISENNAFKSISKLNSLSLSAGDKVLFKSGCIFVGEISLTASGTKENPIVISSYGKGAKPILTTNNKSDIMHLFDCSYITVDNLEITAPNGGGIWVNTYNITSVGITISNIYFHDIQYTYATNRDNLATPTAARAAIVVKSLPADSRYAVNDFIVKNCEFYHCGNGISMWGSWNDQQNPWCTVDEIDPIFNTGFLVDSCSFSELDSEAIVIGMCDGAIIQNCSVINCCRSGYEDTTPFYTAALWFWGSQHSVVQSCEVAGQKNYGDGMTVDFDSYTDNCIYQYIYSHDNTRFMCTCPYDRTQVNNTVRYCLSVNDYGTSHCGSGQGEFYFNFYNNTIVNAGNFEFDNCNHATIKNNIFNLSNTSTFKFEKKYEYDISNNCYYGTFKPFIDKENSFRCNPQFVGGDTYDPNSYVLKSCSPCISAGTQVKEDMGKYDFYGNPLTDTHNIGCYEGSGVDGKYIAENPLNVVKDFVTMIYSICYKQVVHDIKWVKKMIVKLEDYLKANGIII